MCGVKRRVGAMQRPTSRVRQRIWDDRPSMTSQGRYIAGWPPLLFAAWVAAWMLDLALRDRFQ
jgi:hypothetical protein